jgi:hypothetical protein
MIRRLVHNTRETGQGQWRMNAHCASSHPGRASENGASPLLSSERSTSPLHSQRLRRPGHCGSDPGASHPTPSSAAADPPGILRRKDRHIQAGGQDGLQERGRGHPGFLARVRKGSPAPSAESERSELCPAIRNATWRNRTYRATSRRTALQSPWRRSLIPGRLCQEASGAERMGLRGWVWVMGLPLDRGRVYHPRPHPEKIIEQLDPDIPFCRA